MPSVNKAIVMGHLGHNVEMRYTNSETPVTNLSIATNRKWYDDYDELQSETEWHKVTVFGQQAEFLNEYATKGDVVYVEGRLDTNEFTDNEGMERRTKTIVAQNVELVGVEGSQEEFPDDPQPHEDEFGQSFEDDDIPF